MRNTFSTMRAVRRAAHPPAVRHAAHPPARHRAALLATLAAALPMAAQAQPVGEPSTLPPVVITGNPLGSDSLATPASVLAGSGLVLKRASSLGETLAGLPGVSSSYFGPNASRPVIRGQDGERIRILNNAGATLDASALSFDHAVPLDPLAVERIEVLRGPAALLYGGSAIGGVVNVIDNRIPQTRIDGVTGALELRGGGAARERAASALVEVGGEGFALHADAFTRRTDDLRVPDFDRPVDGGGSERRDRIVNSASDAEGGALGGSLVWDRGYLGVAVDTTRNDYGIVAEEDVLIRMQRDKLALAGEWRNPGGAIRAVRGRLQSTDYEHEEVEGSGEVGTRFSNEGTDGRLEIEHAPIGALKGVVGLQIERADFEALGEEAFVPNTETRQFALFVHEELALAGASKLSFGARIERSRVDSAGDADPDEPKFGDAQSRRFTARSAAVGGVWDLAGALGSGWQATGNLAYTERAPASYELYANGVHLATSAFERGDPDVGKEKGANLDVALEWKQGADRLRAGAFVSQFSNYIALLRTGEPDVVSDEGDSFPVYAFEGVKARLHGVELEAAKRLLDATGTLDVEAQLDWVRASNRTRGEPLPRIAPLRATLGAVYGFAGWTLRGEVVHAARQSRVPADDEPTPSYTLVNLALAKQLAVAGSNALLFLRVDNLGDELAYNAGSIATVRVLAPLPGRSISAGLRVAF
jgi:iron complex outermembrane receptor protein